MHRAQTAKPDIVPHGDVTGQGDIVSHDNIIADMIVMRDVRANHDKAIVPNRRETAKLRHAGMRRRMFAEYALLPHDQPGFRRGLKADNLGHPAQYCVGVQCAACTEFGVAGYNGMRHENRTVPDLRVRTDMAERSDGDVLTESGAVLDECGGMNLCGHEFPASCGRPRADYPFFLGFAFFCNQAISRIH